MGYRAVPFFIVALGGGTDWKITRLGELENLEKMLGWGLTAKRYFIFMIKKCWGGVSDRVKIEKKCEGGSQT